MTTVRHVRTGLFAALALLMWVPGIFGEWKPPTGIPMPEFGITNTHWMYTNTTFTFNFGSGPVPYPSTTNGPYTHYIDITATTATDSSNPFGSPTKPRRTIPMNLPPGSVVEVHGGPYIEGTFNGRTMIGLSATGTVSKPVFIRGSSSNAMPTMARQSGVYGSYLVIENLRFLSNNIVIRSDLAPTNVSCNHLVFRDLLMTGSGVASGASSAIGGIGSWSTTNKPFVTHVVVWNNNISGYGDFRVTSPENDYQGVEVDGYCANDVWVLDNDIHHMGGDSVRIGSNPTSFAYTTVRVYVGRNKLHENRENALDIKGIHDAVISENEMFGFAPSSSDNGAAIPIHYNCGNIWIVNNRIHDSEYGVICSDAENIYFCGNVLYNLGRGIEFFNQQELHIVANTFSGFRDRGVNDVGGGNLTHPIVNNIFNGLQDATGYHLNIGSGIAAVSAMNNNLFFEPNSSPKIRWAGGTFSSISSFQSGSGKGAGCLSTDPQFLSRAVSDFRLALTSPAKGAGASISSYQQLFASKFLGQTIVIDLAGSLRPLSPAIGALENVQTEKPPKPANARVEQAP